MIKDHHNSCKGPLHKSSLQFVCTKREAKCFHLVCFNLLDFIHHLVFYIKNNVLKSGFAYVVMRASAGEPTRGDPYKGLVSSHWSNNGPSE
jgi:hypothetical protein